MRSCIEVELVSVSTACCVITQRAESCAFDALAVRQDAFGSLVVQTSGADKWCRQVVEDHGMSLPCQSMSQRSASQGAPVPVACHLGD